MAELVNLAAFRLVHNFPGGATALAPVIGKAHGTLSHEVSPNFPTAKMGLADAVRLSAYTGDLQILNAFAAELGCTVVPPPASAADLADLDEVLARTARLAREFGDLMGVTARSLEDGRVSDNELSTITREASELVIAVQGVLALMIGMNANPGPPRPSQAPLRHGQPPKSE